MELVGSGTGGRTLDEDGLAKSELMGRLIVRNLPGTFEEEGLTTLVVDGVGVRVLIEEVLAAELGLGVGVGLGVRVLIEEVLAAELGLGVGVGLGVRVLIEDVLTAELGLGVGLEVEDGLTAIEYEYDTRKRAVFTR